MPKVAKMNLDIFGGLDLFAEEDVALDPNLVFIEDEVRWKKCCNLLTKSPELSIDFETRSLKPLEDSKQYQGALDPYKGGEIRLMSITTPSMNGLVMMIDLGAENEREHLYQNFFNFILFPLLRNPNVIKRAHNAVFELTYLLHKFKLTGLGFRCSMIASQIYWAGLGKAFASEASKKGKKDYRVHSLGAVGERLGYEVDKAEQKSQWGLKELSNSQLNYSAYDSILAQEIGQKLEALIIEEDLWNSYEAECLALTFFAYIGYHGLPVNVDKAKQYLTAYEALSEEYVSVVREKIPESVNLHSPTQLKKFLVENFDEINYLEATGVEDLTPYKHIPAIANLIRYKSLFTQLSYLKALIRYTDEDNHVRGKFRQIGPTGMGRSTCGEKKINLQNSANMRKEWKAAGLRSARECFEAPEGRKLIICDLSQAHAQIAFGGAKHDIGDKDIHLMNAVEVAKIEGLDFIQAELEGVELTYDSFAKIYADKKHPKYDTIKSLRNLAKPVHYGNLNLQGRLTLQGTFFTKPPFLDIDLEICGQMINSWREVNSKVYQYQRSIIRTANRYNYKFPGSKTGIYGEVRGLSGRRLYLEKMPSDYSKELSVKGTDCVSQVWQSTEKDSIAWSVGQYMLWLSENPDLDCHPASFTHDDAIFECAEKDAYICAKKLKELFDEGMQRFTPNYSSDDPEMTKEEQIQSMIVNNLSEK